MKPEKPPEAVLHVSEKDRMYHLTKLYQGLSVSLQEKVFIRDDRLSFKVKGVGAQIAPHDTKFLGCFISDATRDMLLKIDYNSNHVLAADVTYELAFFFVEEIINREDRTMSAMKRYAEEVMGSLIAAEAQGELSFLVRTLFSQQELALLGITYIISPHYFPEGLAGPNQLFSKQRGGPPWMQAWLIGECSVLEEGVAVAFLKKMSR